MRKALSVLLVFAVAFVNGITAYSMNSEYLVPEAWINNPEIYSETINKQSNSNVLDGVFKYYFDRQNNILYTYFSISESSISDKRCDVRVSYTVRSVFDTYCFSVDKNGLCDSSNDMSEFFAAEQSYTVYNNSDQGLFITAVQINNGCLRNEVGINLYINGHVYRIIDNIQLQVMTEQDAIAEEEELSEAQNAYPIQEKTTKPRKNTTQKLKTTRAEKHTTRRLYKSYGKKYYGNSTHTQPSPTISLNGNVQEDEFYYKATMSKTARYYCFAGIALAVVGIIFLCISCLSNKSNKKENEDE